MSPFERLHPALQHHLTCRKRDDEGRDDRGPYALTRVTSSSLHENLPVLPSLIPLQGVNSADRAGALRKSDVAPDPFLPFDAHMIGVTPHMHLGDECVVVVDFGRVVGVLGGIVVVVVGGAVPTSTVFGSIG